MPHISWFQLGAFVGLYTTFIIATISTNGNLFTNYRNLDDYENNIFLTEYQMSTSVDDGKEITKILQRQRQQQQQQLRRNSNYDYTTDNDHNNDNEEDIILDYGKYLDDENRPNDIVHQEEILLERSSQYDTEIDIGVLSNKDSTFFYNIQKEIDNDDNNKRCKRYNFFYNNTNPKNRRIFYGALIANEPWELFEIVATEVYGIYAGMVFVEGNRTQNFTPRPFKRLQHNTTLANMFGLSTNNMIQVRPFVNENKKVRDLDREHKQRDEILIGWKELGMTVNDVGIIADSDETFTRDFLRAIQVCDGIDILDYNKHYCKHNMVKLTASTRVFETTPECITHDRNWYHPDAIIGYCIEGINDNGIHPIAPRTKNSFLRAEGYGKNCGDWDGEKNITDNRYPLWSAADFRRTCGGKMHKLHTTKDYDNDENEIILRDHYTAYHFHNFFSQFNNTRFKYLTYGHADKDATIKSIVNMSNDLQMMYKCVKELPDEPDQRWKRIQGGYNNINPFTPIYFHDNDYRYRRHEYVKDMLHADEKYIKILRQQLGIKDNDEKEENNGKINEIVSTGPAKLSNGGTMREILASYVNKERELVKKGTMLVDIEPMMPPKPPKDFVPMTNVIPIKPKDGTKLITDTGIDISDPALYEAAPDTNGDTSTATVIAMATGYDLRTYKRFVGSLRNTGYNGHIILGLQPNPNKEILKYLYSRNVTIKILKWVNCTYIKDETDEKDIFKKTTCADPYPDIKIRWSRFPLARDWLQECTSCTGAVLIMDARDSVFQLNPFGIGSPIVAGLQVFEEDIRMTTQNWLAKAPIFGCKGIEYDKPMLCSGTTIGTRIAMLKYLEIIYEEMKVWISDIKCHFNMNGDDQSIHNYLYYSNQLPFAISYPQRHGGIVNTVGNMASQMLDPFHIQLQEQGLQRHEARQVAPPGHDGNDGKTWITTDLNITNEYGLFIEFDGSISRVIHQWDRFLQPYERWMMKQNWAVDD